MTRCNKQCRNCPEARDQGNRTYCIRYGIPIWRREKRNAKTTTRDDADLRGLRERNHPDTRMGI